MRFRAPASSANLGPGFDALAVALSLHVEVEVRDSDSLMVTASGEGADLGEDPPSHLAARVVREVRGDHRCAISVHSEIPVGRGLGSSAALAAAAAAAAGSPDPFALAALFDGHPENAAASVFGGLVAATTLESGPVARRLSLDPGLTFVLLVPDRELPTEAAREVLPRTVAMSDAAANLGRMGVLVAGLADRRFLIAEAASDRLHQEARTPLFPEAPRLLEALVDAGALASSWSGAGPSLVGICDEDRGPSVREAGEREMGLCGVSGKAVLLSADTDGLVEVEPVT